MLDPNRDRGEPLACIVKSLQDAEECKDHQKSWRHAKSWTEAQEYLDADADLIDRDGDRITRIIETPANGQQRGTVEIVGGGRYHYYYYEVLLENVHLIQPATPEEEAEAIASILGSVQ